ncbi:PAS domain S-box protein [Methanohalophilus halophilus]|uniref:histidine kinase n=1 Tax=Methanohalophilus halophilus TaxID=2177 RepID=A0A1L3Q3W7_9EURY|nr:PAS domain S-box protein [Methanohalophilus halophilus]APH39471.1 hypothetical protein BHR79_08245 [Methanohalophilus halophilus]SDW99055.1 PAS domain S-box-containing protein [Methanohalophilus halophilus]
MIPHKKSSIDTELFDLWEDNIAIISPDGTIIYTNKSWKQFAQNNDLDPLQCSEGTNYLQICDEATGEYSSESSIAAEGIRDVISGKKSIVKLEYPCHSPDENRWFLLKITPLSKTYPTDVFLQHIDITERKEAELLAKKEQRQLKKAQSIGNMGSWQFNLNTGTITISEESHRIYGLEIGKIYTIKEIQKFPLPEYRSMLDDALEKLVNGEREYDVEFKIKRPSDGCIVDIHSVAEYDSQENTVTGIIQDITEIKKSEAQILKNEQELDAIYQNAPVIMMLVDKERRVRKINDSGAKFAGEYPDELIGMRGGEALRCIHHLDDPKGCGFGPFCDECTVRNTVMDTFATGQSHKMVEATLPFLIEGKKKELTFLLSTSLIHFMKGPMVLVSILDITARKESEDEIKKLTEEYQTVFQGTQDAMFLMEVSDNNTFRYIRNNRAHQISTGFTLAYFRGKTPQELAGKKTGDQLSANYKRCVDSKDTVSYEETLEFPAGTRTWHVTLTPIFQNNEVRYIVGSRQDITERKEAENALIQSEAKFKSYIIQAPDGIFITDINGYYVDVNPAACEMTGYSEDELLGMNLLDILPHDIHEYAISKFEDSKNKGKIDIEIPYLTKEGDRRWWRITAAALSENRVIGFVKDITNQKDTESALSEALTNSQQREKEITELLNSTTAILEIDDFEVVARHIFDACARVIGAKAGYVALLSDTGEENELLFLEDGGMPCSVDPDLPMPVRGLRAEAYETGEVVYENDFMASEWVKYMPEGHMVLPNVLFSPLNVEGKTVGILGFAYKDGDFTEHDAWLAKTFGEYAAIALRNSHNFELLEKSEQRYRSIFETAANLITSVDSNGIIVDCNNQVKQVLGYDKGEIIGHPMSKTIHPDYHDKAFASLKEILESGYSNDKEYKMVKKNGEIIDVLINSSGINKSAEGYERTNCIISDITESKENVRRINYLTSILKSLRNVNQLIVTEQDPINLIQGICDNLTENQGYYNVWISLLDQYQNPIVVRQSGIENGFDLLLSQLRNKGLPYCARKALKENQIFVIDTPSEKCTACLVEDKCKQSIRFVSKFEYANKTYGIISAAVPYKYAYDEEVMSLFKEVVGDISFALYSLELEANRQKAEEALLESKIVAEEANRTKSEFLANMSHELRTPLNSVLGFSQILEKNPSNHLDDNELKYIGNVYRSGKHLLGLINNILDISKVESGNMDYVPENVNFAGIIDDTVVLIEPMANKKEIYLNYNNESGNINLQIDRMKFKEILYNLLSNAIKFTPAKGEVFIKSKIIDDHIQVSVSDTGVGIPEEEYQSIFDPFKQADSSSTRKYGGTGLGLALVKKYVEMHGGDIWIESEVGKGSTFTFTIPLKGDEQE